MIPVSDPKRGAAALRDEIVSAMTRVVDSGWYILGGEVSAFEEEFARYVGIKHAVSVASGTDALTLSLMVLGVGPGDGVVTVPNTAFPTAAAITRAGGRPVFVDVDPVSRTMDPYLLEELLKSGGGGAKGEGEIKGIIPVHLYGGPADMDAVNDIAKKNGLFVLEDCAQAHGALYKGVKAGTMSDIAAFSFYPTKNLPALGDAGMIVTDSDKLAERARSLRNYGQSSQYIHEDVGMNSRMDDLQASVLRLRLKALDRDNGQRREIAKKYDAGIKGEFILPREIKYTRHIYHLYVIETEERVTLIDHLKREDVGCGIHYPRPIHLQNAYKDLGYGRGDFPVSEKLADTVISIPVFPELEDGEVERVIEALNCFKA
ncbi:MAG: DegT/DnrJ/EryC1/StrS family aminotransferase [Deltaproteobacteria bacterium]|uniref:DegT/DnrJ/EryC1/StrS family aminotransferase n=1 Tax=Candidatus Zymogenus saltonus TaxID=2844893 RepID=A0A9D8KCS1_9DELT|nr:DegT/DnrJ/EryC1/StrS family aminotransferase [Candidatus Zymogenus saltonus]